MYWEVLRQSWISPWRCDLHVQVCNGELRHCGPGMSQPLQLARARGLFAHVEADPSDHSDGLKLDALLTCFRMFWIWMSGWKGQRWHLSSWALRPCVLGWVCWDLILMADPGGQRQKSLPLTNVLKLDTERRKSRRAADAKLAKSRQSESVLPLQKRTDALFGWFCLCCDAFWSKVQRETPCSTSTCMRLNDSGRERDEKHTSITNILGYILGYIRIYLHHGLCLKLAWHTMTHFRHVNPISDLSDIRKGAAKSRPPDGNGWNTFNKVSRHLKTSSYIGSHYQNEMEHRMWYNMILIEGSLEVKLPTIWTDEKQSRAEAKRRERLEERRVEEKESEERR